MKILIIGDHPETIGGVTNYTRPLAQKLAYHDKVAYLYNTSRLFEFDFSSMSIESKPLPDVGFDVFELKNGRALEKNYDQLEVDTGSWMDALFRDFLEQQKPDVIHINEIFGFSSSIVSVANDLSIPVLITVHEYWWLCPHRVMVDFNRKICEGPESMAKCSECVVRKLVHNKAKDRIFREKIKNTFPGVVNLAKRIKSRLPVLETNSSLIDSLSFGNASWKVGEYPLLENKLANRLEQNIRALNQCHKVIAVSNHVKYTLMKFGVQEHRIQVQHIGSLISEQAVEHIKLVDKNDLVFGFIGGVGYYKGIHQLVEAFLSLPVDLLTKASLQIYGKYAPSYVKAIYHDFINDNPYDDRIHFHGAYRPEQIPDITNKIDVSVLPSLCADTAPQTIFESNSCGLSVIGPDIGGFPDFIEHDVNGRLFEAASVKSLSEQLRFIIENPDAIRRYQDAIQKHKTIDVNIMELKALYADSFMKNMVV